MAALSYNVPCGHSGAGAYVDEATGGTHPAGAYATLVSSIAVFWPSGPLARAYLIDLHSTPTPNLENLEIWEDTQRHTKSYRALIYNCAQN